MDESCYQFESRGSCNMISPKPWDLDAILFFASLLMVSLLGGILAARFVPNMIPKLAGDDAAFLRFVISTLSFHGVALVLGHYFLRAHRVRWREVLVGERSGALRVLAFGIGAGVVVLPVALLLNDLSYRVMTLFHLTPQPQAAVAVVEKAIGLGKQISFGIAAIALVPLVEELLFRGILYPFLKRQTYRGVAIAVTSLLFAAIHLNLLTFVPLVVLALVLIAVYEKTDALLTPILTHAFFNAVNFFMLIHPEWVRSLQQLRERI